MKILICNEWQEKSCDLSTMKIEDIDDGTIHIVASTETKDRDRDIVKMNWRYDPQSTPLLYSHNDTTLLPVGMSDDVQSSDKLYYFGRFAPTTFAQEARILCKKRFIRGASAGFKVFKKAPLSNGGWIFLDNYLVEQSICPIPSNPDTKIITTKSIFGNRQNHELRRTVPLKILREHIAWVIENVYHDKIKYLAKNFLIDLKR